VTIAGEAAKSVTFHAGDPLVGYFGMGNTPEYEVINRMYYSHIIFGLYFTMGALIHGVNLHYDFKDNVLTRCGVKIQVI